MGHPVEGGRTWTESQNPHLNVAKGATLRMGHPAREMGSAENWYLENLDECSRTIRRGSGALRA